MSPSISTAALELGFHNGLFPFFFHFDSCFEKTATLTFLPGLRGGPAAAACPCVGQPEAPLREDVRTIRDPSLVRAGERRCPSPSG